MADVGHTDLPPSSVCCLHPCKSEHRWSRLRCSPLRLTTAAGAGSRDCALRLDVRLIPTPLLRHGVGRGVRTCGYKLSLTATFPLSPPPLRCRGVGTLHSAVNPATSACFSDSQGQSSCLRPPVGALPPFATILPPISGLMNARRLARGTRSLFVCDADPNPKPRCTVRRCTDSTPAVGQPLHSLRVCLRLRARAGRLTVCGASSSTESLSLRTSATPAICSNPDVGTPSSLRSFG